MTFVPAGDYSLVRIAGDLFFTAGMTPRRDGKLVATGLLGVDLDLDAGRELAAIAAARAIEAASTGLPENRRLGAAISMTVFIAVHSSFTRLSEVADGASASIRELLPGTVMPVRTAVGVASLPGDAPVEVQLVGVIESVSD